MPGELRTCLTQGVKTKETKETSFSAWSAAQGVTTNGIGCREIPGRGLGVVAGHCIKAGAELVNVPLSALLTVDSVPTAFRKQHKSTTIHGLLASFLAFGGSLQRDYAPWAATWPTVSDFRKSIPVCWPQHDRTTLTSRLLDETVLNADTVHHLPPAMEQLPSRAPAREPQSRTMRALLSAQRSKLRADWGVVAKIFPDASFERYLYYWLVVNTRSFYFEVPDSKIQPSREDRMVLCPFIDLFNHSDSGCAVQFGRTGFTVTSDKAYEPGDEICVSYGPHGNDFLLVEYGFLLDKNRWDSVAIDHILMDYLIGTPAEKQLQRAGYLGDYTVSREGICCRTEVAVRTQTLTNSDWNHFVQGIEIEHADDKRNAGNFVRDRLLVVFCREVDRHIEQLHNLTVPLGPRQVLIRRWREIQALLERAAESLPVHNGNQSEANHLAKD